MPNVHRSLSRMRIFAGTEYRRFTSIPYRFLRSGISCFEHMMPGPPHGGMDKGRVVSNIGFVVASDPGTTYAEYLVIDGVIQDPALWLCGLSRSIDGILSVKVMRRQIAPIQYTEPDGYNLCA